jgi:hypothetical protein
MRDMGVVSLLGPSLPTIVARRERWLLGPRRSGPPGRRARLAEPVHRKAVLAVLRVQAQRTPIAVADRLALRTAFDTEMARLQAAEDAQDLPWQNRSNRATLKPENKALTGAPIQRGYLVIRKGPCISAQPSSPTVRHFVRDTPLTPDGATS